MVPKSAIKAFLNRDLDNYLWMKKLGREILRREIGKFKVRPVFKTESWTHQLVCFYIGMCCPEFLFLLDMGAGKALPLTERVVTPTGYKTIGDIKLGDFVIGKNGKPTKVTGIFPQGVKPVLNFIFSDGVEVCCTDEHLWEIHSPNTKNRKSSGKVVEAHTLVGNLRFKGKEDRNGVGNRKCFVPVSEPVEFSPQNTPLPLHPYVLGVLLGDGSLTGANCGLTFHAEDVEILTFVMDVLPQQVKFKFNKDSGPSLNCKSVGFSGKGWLRSILRSLGVNKVSYFKSIPDAYLKSSIADRKEILAGLLDTDGWATNSGSFCFYTASRVMATQVQELIHCLGGTARLKAYGAHKHGQHYEIHGRTPFNPFRLKRKQDKFSSTSNLSPYRSIESIEFIGEAECVCISVEAEDGLFLTNGAVVTHNSKIILDLITQFQREQNLNRALVTVPRLINLGTWETAIIEHSNLEPIMVMGSIEEKWERLIAPTGDIAVIDYAGLQTALTKKEKVQGKNKLVRDDKKIAHLRTIYDFIALDESHKAKNKDSSRFSILWQLMKTAKYRYATTGTLFGRTPEDLWGQFYLIDQGETFGATLGMFRAAFFKEVQDFWKGTTWEFDKSKADLLNHFLQHRSIRYDETELNDLPKRQELKLQVKFESDSLEHYLRAVEGLINAQGNLTEIDSAFIRMRQITSGYLQWKDEYGKHTVPFIRNPKLDMLEGIIEDSDNSRVVISYEYTKTGELITEWLKKHGYSYEWVYGGSKDKYNAVGRFLKDKTKKVFLMNSESGGTGIDGLQEIAQYLVFFECPCSPITRQQVIKRIHRPGQKKRTFIYDLVMEGSIDYRILSFIQKGKDLHEAVMGGGGINLLKILSAK